MPAGATEFLGRAIIILVVIVVTIMIIVPMIRGTNTTLFNFGKDKDDNDLISIVASRDVYARETTKQLTTQLSSVQDNVYAFDKETKGVLDDYFIAYGIMFDGYSKEKRPVVINLKKEKSPSLTFINDQKQSLGLENACFYFNNSKLTDLEINGEEYKKNYVDVTDTWFYDSSLFTKTSKYFGDDIHIGSEKNMILPEDFNPENFVFEDDLDIMCITYILDPKKESYFSNKLYFENGNCHITYDGITFVYDEKLKEKLKKSEGDCRSLLEQEKKSYNILVNKLESLLNNDYDLFYTLNLSESKDLNRSMLIYGYYNYNGTISSAVMRLIKDDYTIISKDKYFYNILKENLEVKNLSGELKITNDPSYILEDFKIINNDRFIIFNDNHPMDISIDDSYFSHLILVYKGFYFFDSLDNYIFSNSSYSFDPMFEDLYLLNLTRIIINGNDHYTVTNDWQYSVFPDDDYGSLQCDPYSFIEKSENEETKTQFINFMERKDTHLFNEFYDDLKSAFIMNNSQQYNKLDADDYIFLRSVPMYGYYDSEPLLILFYFNDSYCNDDIYRELKTKLSDESFSINITCEDSEISTESYIKCKQNSIDYFKEEIILTKIDNYLLSITSTRNDLSSFTELKEAIPLISKDSFYPIFVLAKENSGTSCSLNIFFIRNLNDFKRGKGLYLFEKYSKDNNCYFKYDENYLFVSLFEPTNQNYLYECGNL